MKIMTKQIKLQKVVFNTWSLFKSSEGFEQKTHSEFANYLLSYLTRKAETSENQSIDVCGLSDDEVASATDNLNLNDVFNVDVDLSTQSMDSTLTAIESPTQKRTHQYVVVTPEAARIRPGHDLLEDSNDFAFRSTPQVKKVKKDFSLIVNEPNLTFLSSPTSNEDTSFFDELEDDPFDNAELSDSDESIESSISSASSESTLADESDDDLILGDTSDMNNFENLVNQMKGIDINNDVDFDICSIREKYVLKDTLETEINMSMNYGNVTKNCEKSINMSLCSNINTGDTLIDASVASNLEEVKMKLQSCFTNCYESDSVEKEMSFVQKDRLIVSIDKLKELRGDFCCHKYEDNSLCPSKVIYEISGKGSCRQLKWKCLKNHTGKWYSSEILTVRHTCPVFVNDLLLTSCVLLSGNNWSKFELLSKFMHLQIPVYKVFSRNQNFYFSPEVQNMWSLMTDNINSVLTQYSQISLCGDGRNDSPGHCARFCTYVLMEHFTKVVVDLEVMDSRESKGISTNMERDALIRLLLRLHHLMEISEITTDASTSIIKVVRDMAAKYPSLANIEHSLDIWHKAKSIRKALHEVAKANEEITPWIDPIINHFWHCCKQSENDLDKLKNMWLGVLHHVCGEHTWAGSQCSHGDLTKDDPKTPLEKTSNAMEALRSKILDPRLMKSLVFYTRFRHTSNLENFNSMLLKYASKRVGFEYEYYGLRMMLAAMDHNIHLFRPAATTKSSGDKVFKHQYCKRVKHWHAEPVKVPKLYPHIPYLLANIFKARINDTKTVNRRFSKSDKDPKIISPTISGNKPPSLATLVSEKISRLKKD